MIGKSIRLLIILCITGFVLWSSRWIYVTLYDLLDFQITLYRYMLTTQNTIADMKTSVAGSRNLFLQNIGAGGEGRVEVLPTNQRSLDEQVAIFANKIKLISGIISAIIGFLFWKILFDIVFGIKTLMSRLGSFVTEPVTNT